MLNKAFEFLRIADPKPSNEKVGMRTKAAADLVTKLAKKENQSLLLAFLQGVVAGFDNPPFTQESPAVVALIKAIKEQGGDATLPADLKENALELRALAGMVVGELLEKSLKDGVSDGAMLAALGISAASLRPATKDKYLEWMRSELLAYAGKVLHQGAAQRRQRGTPALSILNDIKLPEEESEEEGGHWMEVLPAIRAALSEATAQAMIDREETDILWWMFAGFSEIEQKPLAKLSPSAAAFTAGVELGRRALLPPSPTATAMVERAAASGRKATALASITLEAAASEWTEALLDGLLPGEEKGKNAVSQCPALLPLTSACRWLREGGGAKVGKELSSATGLALDELFSPVVWGAQAFRETVFLRVVAGAERS
jgi:hypothetical protein